MNIKPDPVIYSPNEHPEYVTNFINEYIELCNKYNLYIDGCYGGDLIIEDIITTNALDPFWIKQAEYYHYIKEESCKQTEVARLIWDIAKISPEHGNAVMDIIGCKAYNNVMTIVDEEENHEKNTM